MKAKELAEVIYDLMRSAPILCMVNGEKGRAAFFGRDAQKAQLVVLLENYRAATPTEKADPRHLSAWAKRIADGIVFPNLPPLEHSKAVTFLESELESFLEAAQIGAATKAETHAKNCKSHYIQESTRKPYPCDCGATKAETCPKCGSDDRNKVGLGCLDSFNTNNADPWHSPAPASHKEKR